MQHEDETAESPLDPQVQQIFDAAFTVRLDVETAARHLWAIHRAGAESGALPAPHRPPKGASDRATPQEHAVPRWRGALVGAGTRSLVLVLGVLVVLSGGGVAVAASSHALPGEVLYPVKLGAERVQILVTVGAQRDARLHLRIAGTRLAEATSVAPARPQDVPALLTAAVDAMERAERLAGAADRPAVLAMREQTTATVTDLVALMGADSGSLEVVAERLGLVDLALSAAPAPAVPSAASAPSRTVPPVREGASIAAPAPRPIPRSGDGDGTTVTAPEAAAEAPAPKPSAEEPRPIDAPNPPEPGRPTATPDTQPGPGPGQEPANPSGKPDPLSVRPGGVPAAPPASGDVTPAEEPPAEVTSPSGAGAQPGRSLAPQDRSQGSAFDGFDGDDGDGGEGQPWSAAAGGLAGD